jgi:hypothetical protein
LKSNRYKFKNSGGSNVKSMFANLKTRTPADAAQNFAGSSRVSLSDG